MTKRELQSASEVSVEVVNLFKNNLGGNTDETV